MDARSRALLKQQIVFLATALIATSVMAQAGMLGPGTVQALSAAAFLTSIIRILLPGSLIRASGARSDASRQARSRSGKANQANQVNQVNQAASARSESERVAPARYTVAVIDAHTQGVREVTSLRFNQPFRERVESEFTHTDGTRTPSVGILIGKPAFERLTLYRQNHETLLERTEADPDDVIGGYAVQSREGKPLAAHGADPRFE
jgi:hypothetical protein